MAEVTEHARMLEGKIDATLTTCENEKKKYGLRILGSVRG